MLDTIVTFSHSLHLYKMERKVYICERKVNGISVRSCWPFIQAGVSGGGQSRRSIQKLGLPLAAPPPPSRSKSVSPAYYPKRARPKNQKNPERTNEQANTALTRPIRARNLDAWAGGASRRRVSPPPRGPRPAPRRTARDESERILRGQQVVCRSITERRAGRGRSVSPIDEKVQSAFGTKEAYNA